MKSQVGSRQSAVGRKQRLGARGKVLVVRGLEVAQVGRNQLVLSRLGLMVIQKYGFHGSMKTTLEIPDALYREVKVTAAQTGKTVTAIVQSALKRELTANTNQPDAQTEKPWTKWAGCLSEIPKEEHKKIRLRIEETFSEIDKEMWQ